VEEKVRFRGVFPLSESTFSQPGIVPGLTLKNGAGLLLELSATVTLPGAPDPFT
jgi:hypothetical protein